MSRAEEILKVLWRELRKQGNKQKILPAELLPFSKMVALTLELVKDGTDVQVLMKFLAGAGVSVTFEDIGFKEETAGKIAAAISRKLKKSKTDTSAHALELALVKINNWGEKYKGKKNADALASELVKQNPFFYRQLRDFKGARIVFLGDSQMDGRLHWSTLAGFPDILNGVFKITNKKFSAVNAGVGGNKTWQALERFKKDVLDKNPEVCVFMFGANDSWPDEKGRPKVALPSFKKNYLKIISILKKNRIKPVLMSLPYAPGFSKGTQYLKYNEVITTLAKKNDLPLIEVYDRMKASNPSALVSLDGGHMTTKGHLFMTEVMAEAILDGKI